MTSYDDTLSESASILAFESEIKGETLRFQIGFIVIAICCDELTKGRRDMLSECLNLLCKSTKVNNKVK